MEMDLRRLGLLRRLRDEDEVWGKMCVRRGGKNGKLMRQGVAVFFFLRET